MHRIAGAIAAEPGLTVNGIRDGVKGNNSYKQEALRLLISEGFVERREEGTAKRHYPLRPFTEESTAPTAPKVAPDRAQAHPDTTAPRAPLPRRGRGAGAAVEDHPSEEPPRPTLEVVPTTTCTCSRPARSPRAEGPPVCMKCRKPVEVAA